ncbi:hypothetical protein BBJ28_00023823 [Nothophytophthora sp. Chile5]|nr:hypothetical protein BBJ28_00023823 [Nothophytophthora sp. Chile5]
MLVKRRTSYMTRDDDASYPAANFTYCSSNDATCSSCHDGWMDAFSAGSLDLTQRCVGTSGCICLSACEVPNRDAQIVQNTCSMYGSGANSAQIGLIVGMTVGAFLVFTLFVVLANLVVKRTAARREARQQAEREARLEMRRPAASAHLPQLNLTGWTDMREKLVQNEHGQMEGAAKPTLSSTTAPAVIAEEDGEGYRPLLPSDRHSQRGD